jgi:hypothetical protein
MTTTCKGAAKPVPTTVDCGDPPRTTRTIPGKPGTTVSCSEVTDNELPTSVTVMVWLPAILSTTWNVLEPAFNVEAEGSVAKASPLEKCTVPV